MIKFITCIAFAFLVSTNSALASAQNYQLFSQNRQIKIEIQVDGDIRFSVYFNNKPIITNSSIFLSVEGCDQQAIITGEIVTRTVSDTLTPVLPAKNSKVVDKYNELSIPFNTHYTLVFRAYDGGVAYRFQTQFEDEITVLQEKGEFNFYEDYPVYFSEEEDAFYSQGERNYTYKKLSELNKEFLGFLPALVAPPQGPKILITESDLFDYPGMWLKPTGSKQLKAVFPFHVAQVKREKSGVNSVVERDNYLAKTKGTRNFPWRIFIIAEEDIDLLENEMVFCLSQPNKIKNTSWIKPGKIAWEWWNHINVTGVDFKVGLNTETYEYFIDFATEYGLDYVVLDAGWYTVGNIFDLNPDIDMDRLTAYAGEKKVGLILRVIWRDVDDQHEKAFAQFEKWGIAGLKVDQMRRDDQDMVNYYWRVARQAAEHKILINFHGNYKPAGLHRTYPNVITREGVKGLEWVKWSGDITPEHNVTIPFIRMVAGPMDYTPGAMINVAEKDFRIMDSKPMSMGTRAHQMAMYVIYESPQSTLSDTPVHYRQEPLCAKFMADTPEIWDETIALDGKVGVYIAMARRKGDIWYAGAMAGKKGKDLEIDFSFLAEGTHEIEVFKDGVNTDRNMSDYIREIMPVTNKTKLQIRLAPGGGWVARIKRGNPSD
ncbi:MAG: glycoside hydrolase family 97 protein [Pontiella sp.]